MKKLHPMTAATTEGMSLAGRIAELATLFHYSLPHEIRQSAEQPSPQRPLRHHPDRNTFQQNSREVSLV